MCSGGLRRYLADVGTLPTQPLITNIPVSVRRVNKTREAGNSISWAMVSLATDVDDVRQRFDTIRSATGQAKKRLQQLGDTIDTYTLLVTTPILLEQVVGLGGHLPPMFNIPISNVPGPRTAKYLNGARLREIYALTVLYGGQALNTVAVSYAGWLNFSFTACGDSLPHVQRLAVFCREALEELEQTYADHENRTDTTRRHECYPVADHRLIVDRRAPTSLSDPDIDPKPCPTSSTDDRALLTCHTVPAMGVRSEMLTVGRSADQRAHN
jgi:diacylglycerol O-acyltransferase